MAQINDVFAAKVTIFGPRAMRDLGVADYHAAAIFGNAGHESGGLRTLQEIGHKAGRGGWGWFQWTGPRRVAFEAWARAKGLGHSSDEANYGFLIHELLSTHKYALTALKATRDLSSAVSVFERKYEAAGIINLKSRMVWANVAMGALRKGTVSNAKNVAIAEKAEAKAAPKPAKTPVRKVAAKRPAGLAKKSSHRHRRG